MIKTKGKEKKEWMKKENNVSRDKERQLDEKYIKIERKKYAIRRCERKKERKKYG